MSEPLKPSTHIVRRKTSQRKGRAELVEHRAKRPSQKRSLDRFNGILAATELLLETANIEDISFYDIARQVDLPPASVHYFFPSMSAIRIELCEIYNRQCYEQIVEYHRSQKAVVYPSWQDRIRSIGKLVRDYFNTRRPVCEILLGPVLHREARLAGMDANDIVGLAAMQSLKDTYLLPDIPDLHRTFANNAEILDALWSRSYLRNGWIDDITLEETLDLQIANLRLLLPERLFARGEQSSEVNGSNLTDC